MQNVTIDEAVYSRVNTIINGFSNTIDFTGTIYKQCELNHIRPKCSECKKHMHINKKRIINLRDSSDVLHLYMNSYEYYIYKCDICGKISTEKIPDRVPGRMYTKNYQVEALVTLSGFGITLKKAAELLHTNQKMLKEIHKAYLTRKGGELLPKHPDGSTRYSNGILIDEFKLHDDRSFCTMILDYDTSKLLYLEQGRGKAQVHNFHKYIGDDFFKKLKFVSCDMSATYPYAFNEINPKTEIVYDLFHLRQAYNEKVLNLSRKEQKRKVEKLVVNLELKVKELTARLNNNEFKQREGKIKEKRAILAQIRDLKEQLNKLSNIRLALMSNKETLALRDKVAHDKNTAKRNKYKSQGLPIPPDLEYYKENYVESVEAVCTANSKIKIVYELGEELWKILDIRNDEKELIKQLKIWMERASVAHIRQLTLFVKMLKKRWKGIISRSKYHVSSGKIEGLNCWIKNRRRLAYGFADFEYFALIIWDYTHTRKQNSKKRENYYSQDSHKKKIPKHITQAKPTIFQKHRNWRGLEIEARG